MKQAPGHESPSPRAQDVAMMCQRPMVCKFAIQLALQFIDRGMFIS